MVYYVLNILHVSFMKAEFCCHEFPGFYMMVSWFLCDSKKKVKVINTVIKNKNCYLVA